MKKIVLTARDIRHIHEVQGVADDLNIPSYLIEDFGLTEVPANTITGIAISIDTVENVNQITRSLDLY
jgi:PTH2 family peptidyl-tRNA hydrolase